MQTQMVSWINFTQHLKGGRKKIGLHDLIQRTEDGTLLTHFLRPALP